MSSIVYIKGNAPTWIVVINDQYVYEMSRDADMPNGVCIFVGETGTDETDQLIRHGVRYDGDIPRGMVRKIMDLAVQDAATEARRAMCLHAREAVEYVGRHNGRERERAALTWLMQVTDGDTSKTIDQIAEAQDP